MLDLLQPSAEGLNKGVLALYLQLGKAKLHI